MTTSGWRWTLAAAFLLYPAHVFGWGPNGHRIVGEVAERYLSEHARRQIAVLLDGDSLAEAATWPDDIRSDPNWARATPWHFLSIDDGETLATTARDPNGDVLEALRRFEAVLRDPAAERERKVEALRFFVHFTGDVHQPLHVGRRADRGGNSIRLKWFREPSNLHSVWDVGLIESQSLSFTEFVRFLGDRPPAQVAVWRAAPYEEWVRESFCLRPRVYDYGREAPVPPAVEPELGYVYAFTNMATIEERLFQAGVRLAARLDAIFWDEPAPAVPAAVPSSPDEWCGR